MMTKKIGIIGAMDVETALLLSKMTVLAKTEVAGFTYHACKYNELELIITTCGVGKVNAASCTQIMIDRFSPTAIINTGIAGGMKDHIKVCDVVISTELTYHDVRKEQMKSCFPFKESFKPCKNLYDLAIDATQSIHSTEFVCHTGKIVTGDSFVSDPVLKEKIQLSHDPACVDMESSAIAHIADINSIPFIVFRSISDNADDDATLSYEEFESKAADNSAQIVLKMLETIKYE